jgi:PLD-like domain
VATSDFQVTGRNRKAPFTLKVHRGDGMALLAMNWKGGRPPKDFVGFAIEYQEPGQDRFFVRKNRISFLGADDTVQLEPTPTLISPIQKFRWVHFPRNADKSGKFRYRVTPLFMNDDDSLSQGEPQEAAIELRRDTYPGLLNVAYTRGFVSSQAFVDRYAEDGSVDTLIPDDADLGLDFKPKHAEADDALAWMGFEARHAIFELLDEAIADKRAQVRVVAYDLSEGEVVRKLQKLGKRLKIIIDDDGAHGEAHSAETEAEKRLVKTAGRDNVKRQHMGKLQHNKTIVVDGPKVKAALCGSTNFSWRGFYVQANNAVIMRHKPAVDQFMAAFQAYWDNDEIKAFGATTSAQQVILTLTGIDARVGFSPYARQNALLAKVADDIRLAKSSVFYSLAFLYQTKGAIRQAIQQVTNDPEIFVYGVSDRRVGGLDVQKPNGNVAPVSPTALGRNAPEPFKSEPAGGGGNRMHHKFVVVDFDKPTARVYLGSYNFSAAADRKNGENLLLIRDRRIAVSYMVEALRLFDHYHFRLSLQEAKNAPKRITLAKPPRKAGEKAWWEEDYTDAQKIRDRELFA